MKTYRLLIASAALFLGGCATKPKSLTSSFWQQSGTPVLIAVAELPKQGDFVMQGNQGLLDVAIAMVVTNEVRAATKKVDATTFLEVAKEFEAELSKSGFAPVVHPQPVPNGSLPKRQSGGFDQDFGKLLPPGGARYVLWLEMRNYGALRTYYAFLPTSAPSGFSAVRGRLIDTKDYSVVWDTGNSLQDGVVQETVAGDWKEPPEYTNLMAACSRAVDRSKKFLLDRFFETRPPQKLPATE